MIDYLREDDRLMSQTWIQILALSLLGPNSQGNYLMDLYLRHLSDSPQRVGLTKQRIKMTAKL